LTVDKSSVDVALAIRAVALEAETAIVSQADAAAFI
jgi:hypothetical protein